MSETTAGTMDEQIFLIDGQPASMNDLLRMAQARESGIAADGTWSPQDAAKVLRRDGIEVQENDDA